MHIAAPAANDPKDWQDINKNLLEKIVIPSNPFDKARVEELYHLYEISNDKEKQLALLRSYQNQLLGSPLALRLGNLEQEQGNYMQAIRLFNSYLATRESLWLRASQGLNAAYKDLTLQLNEGRAPAVLYEGFPY